MPTRRTSHSWLPQGWGFFIFRMSLRWISMAGITLPVMRRPGSGWRSGGGVFLIIQEAGAPCQRKKPVPLAGEARAERIGGRSGRRILAVAEDTRLWDLKIRSVSCKMKGHVMRYIRKESANPAVGLLSGPRARSSGYFERGSSRKPGRSDGLLPLGGPLCGSGVPLWQRTSGLWFADVTRWKQARPVGFSLCPRRGLLRRWRVRPGWQPEKRTL